MTSQETFDILSSRVSKTEMIAHLREYTDPGTLIDDLESLTFADIKELYTYSKEILEADE